MFSPSVAVTAWLVFNVVGQWSLLVLLLTFFFVKNLSQRNNPFLVNFLLTTFVGTIPPAILLYTGHQYTRAPPPERLCFVQAILVDSVPPMFGAAQLALVIDTWSEIRTFTLHNRSITRSAPLKYILIISPYILMWIWVFASFITATRSNATHHPGFVYCINNSGPSDAVRKCVGLFMLVVVMIELAFGFCVGWFMYRFPAKQQKDPAAWRRNLHFSLRIITLSFLQLIAIMLSVASAGLSHNPVKIVYELLASMNALATFLAFATQRNILQAWKICKKIKPVDEFAIEWVAPCTLNGPSLETTTVELLEEVFDRGNVDGYFKPLHVGAAASS